MPVLNQYPLNARLAVLIATVAVPDAIAIAALIEAGNEFRTPALVASGLLALGLILAWLLMRSIAGPLGELTSALVRIARDRNLALQIPVRGGDEIARAAQAINALLIDFSRAAGAVNTAASGVAAGSSSLADTSAQLAAQSETHAEATNAVAAAVEQMSASITRLSENATGARTNSARSQDLSEQGGEIIERTVAEMATMASAVKAASESVTQLGHRSDEISDIVHVIREIADQTNLLALNAAIEAARAGEQGRGFAVVADEVRRLAERTTTSTGEISATIERIQAGVRQTTAIMENGVARVDQGVALANQVGDAIAQIRSGAGQLTAAVAHISTSLEEQRAASNDIARRVETIAQISEESSAAAHQSAETAEYLSQAAQSLQLAVGHFRVADRA